MEMLKKLMNVINLKWAQKPRISRVLQLQRGIGNHPYLSIREGSLYFHAYPYVDSFGAETDEVVKHSSFEADAIVTDTEVAYRADFIVEVRNYGTDDLYVNFNHPTSEAGRMTLKPGEVVKDFPRKVQTLFFSSKSGAQPFRIIGTYTNMLYYQQVSLEGMTIRDLCDTLDKMGYQVDRTDAERLGMLDTSALVIMDVSGQALADWVDLFGFTSNWYRVLYPLHRILTKYDGDIDTAIEQITLPTARGAWLDYWASFFRIKRLPDETDDLLLRRVFLTLTSAKSNNMAMEELISYYIGTESQVLDALPAQIEVRVDPQFMDSATKVREIIALLKGAGVDYFINYQKSFEDRYPVFFRDINGKTFGEVNETYSSVLVTLPVYAEDYLYIPPELQMGFVLNEHKLNGSNTLAKPSIRIVESLGMTLTDGATGNILQQM